MMANSSFLKYSALLFFSMAVATGCKVPALQLKTENKTLPGQYTEKPDSTQATLVLWRSYFTDPYLVALIDTALQNNQELNMASQEILMTNNEILARKGEYQPFAHLAYGAGVEHSGKYTWDGVSEEDLKAKPEKFPRFVGDQMLLGVFSWELDPWKKLHNAKDAAVKRYLASQEGRNYIVTNLVAEIANSYYELIVLDQQLSIVQQNVEIQKNALELVRVQKQAARVNELAVNRFESQLLNTQNLQFEIQQMITLTENKINFLLGRYPQPIVRQTQDLRKLDLPTLTAGVPAQLLLNRPDVRQIEQELEATKLDVQVARANFYPNFTLRAGLGFQAFNPIYLINPKSIAFNVLGDMMAPLVNRNAIRATYFNAGAKQVQTVYAYQQTVLNAYLEVMNQLSGSQKYTESFRMKAQQVDVLSKAVDISESLFKSARADYTEVLLTQREALEAKMELTEIKKKQLNAVVNLYKALGGGWQ